MRIDVRLAKELWGVSRQTRVSGRIWVRHAADIPDCPLFSGLASYFPTNLSARILIGCPMTPETPSRIDPHWSGGPINFWPPKWEIVYMG